MYDNSQKRWLSFKRMWWHPTLNNFLMVDDQGIRVFWLLKHLTATRRDETHKTSLLMTFLSPSLGRPTNTNNKNTRHVRSLIVSHRVYLEMGIIPPEAERQAKSFEQSFSTEKLERRSKYPVHSAIAYRFPFPLRLLFFFSVLHAFPPLPTLRALKDVT